MTEFMFHRTLLEFLQGLSQCFPEHTGVQEALGMINAMPANAMLDGMLASGWAEATDPVKDAIFRKDGETVVEAFEKCDLPMIKQLDARSILLTDEVDEDTKNNIWLFITTLTTLAAEHGKAKAESCHSEEAKPHRMPAPGEVAVRPKPAAAKPDINNLVKGFTAAMPEVVKSLNQVLKTTDGEENPLGDLIRNMMGGPGQEALKPGVANNVFANMMGGQDETIMQQAAMDNGLTVDEITEKLRKLEAYEKMRAKRKGKN